MWIHVWLNSFSWNVHIFAVNRHLQHETSKDVYYKLGFDDSFFGGIIDVTEMLKEDVQYFLLSFSQLN